MRRIEFRGHSDDTFIFGHDSHDDAGQGTVRTVIVEAGGERMAVTGVYGMGCMWSIGIAPVDDDEPMPHWPMTWGFRGYSAVVWLTVPDDATVTLVHPEPDA